MFSGMGLYIRNKVLGTILKTIHVVPLKCTGHVCDRLAACACSLTEFPCIVCLHYQIVSIFIESVTFL